MKIVRHQHIVVIYVMLIKTEVRVIAGGLVHLQRHVNQVAGINQIQLLQKQIVLHQHVGYVMLVQMQQQNIFGKPLYHQHLVHQVAGINQTQLQRKKIV